MCNKQTIVSKTAAKNDDDELYASWMLNLESNEEDRKFKVRSKLPIDAGLELISGNLVMAYSDSAPSTPSSRSSARTPDAVSGVFETPERADVAILDTPTKKKRAQFRKNLGKLLQKFQKNKEQDKTFGPTYHKYQYNYSLYDHLDKPNGSQTFRTCIEAT